MEVGLALDAPGPSQSTVPEIVGGDLYGLESYDFTYYPPTGEVSS
jgi:hypothetical protein